MASFWDRLGGNPVVCGRRADDPNVAETVIETGPQAGNLGGALRHAFRIIDACLSGGQLRGRWRSALLSKTAICKRVTIGDLKPDLTILCYYRYVPVEIESVLPKPRGTARSADTGAGGPGSRAGKTIKVSSGIGATGPTGGSADWPNHRDACLMIFFRFATANPGCFVSLNIWLRAPLRDGFFTAGASKVDGVRNIQVKTHGPYGRPARSKLTVQSSSCQRRTPRVLLGHRDGGEERESHFDGMALYAPSGRIAHAWVESGKAKGIRHSGNALLKEWSGSLM